MLIVPYSNSFKKTHQEIKVKLPPVLKDKKIKEIRIIPKQHSRYFEIQYIYEVEEVQRELNKNNGERGRVLATGCRWFRLGSLDPCAPAQSASKRGSRPGSAGFEQKAHIFFLSTAPQKAKELSC